MAGIRLGAGRRLRFAWSLRVLMAAILALAVALAWWGNKARVQRRAVAALDARGVSVTYDYQYEDTKHDDTAAPWGPGWLRRFLGDEYFQEVVSVALLKKEKVADDDLAILEDFPHLRELYARSSGDHRLRPEAP